ncbi:MAG: beta-ketoacyl-[acyl-carrier-protein] synthase family protein [Pirellulaceae bacterium]
MPSRSSVVITGVGVVSPIGIGGEAYWNSLCQQRSGVGVLDSAVQRDHPLSIGAAVKDFDGKLYVKPRKALKVMSREIQTGFSAASLAVEHAGLQVGQMPPDRAGVVFGSDMLHCEPEEMLAAHRRCIENGTFHFDRWGANFASEMYPLWMLMYLPNMIACHIGIAHDARGPNNTICQGDVSSLLAMIEAALIIERGQADIMITGGSSSRLSTTSRLYRGVSDLSPRTDVPEAACRPLDARRDGVVHGEGAAAFVLEREEFAAARGATVLARVAGWGTSFGVKRSRQFTHCQAIQRSLEKALAMSDLSAPDVGHVNAHACGSVLDDPPEAQAIRAVLGDVPVTAPKSYFGCLGASGGAVEMVASVLGLHHGLIPPTLNYSEPDPACPVNVVSGQSRQSAQRVAAVLSQADQGQAVCVTLTGA